MRRMTLRLAGGILVVFVAFGVIAGGVAAMIKRNHPSVGDEDSDELDLVTIFDGLELESRARAFRGGSWLAMMGGGELDLTGATLDLGGGTLRLRAVMGGGQIEVPSEWNVELASRGFMGGSQDTRGSVDRDASAPTLRIEAMTIMGGFVVTSAG